MNERDFSLLSRALALAEKGAYTTTPNPRVGAVIVSGDAVLGEGWHEKAGGPHAEIVALENARNNGHNVRGATLYVSLEPCSHYGKTPPCTKAMIEAGITRVVCAMRDLNPEAARGGEVFKNAGVAFHVCDALTPKAYELNLGFITRVTKGRPFIRVKIAQSIDGRVALADGKSQWITGRAARQEGHHYRARSCAVLTGVGTVLADNPQLNVREVKTTRQPLRIVLDPNGKMPRAATIVQDGNKTLIVTTVKHPITPSETVEILTLPAASDKNRVIDLMALARELARREINELHVEAGGRLNGALLAADLIDELLIYISPRVLGEGSLPAFSLGNAVEDLEAFHRFHLVETKMLGEDVALKWRRKNEKCLQG